jgi:hypothetical protein
MRHLLAGEEALPLVIISHGYPGNRFLLAHLAENIASKGYVVASIDHTDSTYRTRAAFGSTLVNRSLDQIFVLNELARLAVEEGNFLNGLADAGNAAVIGYSMGGYGAIITAGGGVTQAAVDLSWGGPHGTLGVHLSGSDSHNALARSAHQDHRRLRPLGHGAQLLGRGNAQGHFQDPVAVHRRLGRRCLWLREGRARHLAGRVQRRPRAPDLRERQPQCRRPDARAGTEADKVDPDLGFNLAEHYNDAVWDTVRMNNISQHFVTAWLGLYFKGDETMAAYLDLTPSANEGVWAKEDDGAEQTRTHPLARLPEPHRQGPQIRGSQSGGIGLRPARPLTKRGKPSAARTRTCYPLPRGERKGCPLPSRPFQQRHHFHMV